MAIVKFSGLDEGELRKLEAAMKDEAFIDALAEESTAEGVRAALAKKDIHFTVEEIELIRKTLIEAEKEDSEEISEKDLEAVAGGGTFTLISIEWKTKKGTKITINIPW